MNSEKQILGRIKEAVHKVEPSAKIILFGSRARGDNKPDSDWDLLILVNQKKISNQFEDSLLDSIYDIELDTDYIITPVIVEKEVWETKHRFSPFYESVIKEGRLL